MSTRINCSNEQFWKILSFREAVLANQGDFIEGAIRILEDVYWNLVKILAMHFCGGHVYGWKGSNNIVSGWGDVLSGSHGDKLREDEQILQHAGETRISCLVEKGNHDGQLQVDVPDYL